MGIFNRCPGRITSDLSPFACEIDATLTLYRRLISQSVSPFVTVWYLGPLLSLMLEVADEEPLLAIELDPDELDRLEEELERDDFRDDPVFTHSSR